MNWGIISCANIAINNIIPALKRIYKDKRSITLSSRDINKAKELAIKFNCDYAASYEALLEDDSIDAVYIPLPNALHFEWVKKSLLKGKHVLVEKPTTMNFEQSKLLVELAKSRNLALVENFQFQFHSQHEYVKELIKSEEIGEIRSFRSSFGFPPFSESDNIRYKRNLGGGALLDAGAYVLKATTFIMGNGFQVESSFLKYHDEYKVDWFGGAFLVNKEKDIFSEVAFGFDNFYQCNYEIWGSKGKITSTRAFTAKHDYIPSIILEKQGFLKEIKLQKDDHFVNMLNYFINLCRVGNFDIEWNKILEQARLIDQVNQYNT
ncbi:D-xylose 1-dehydrogenase (NADP(+)) [Flavobacteriaceae bacterium UJ101]|nr:D-xylose 1-dehydrogenase (NADP(+)) [Flavobacteriaceae bacterium UJ101]